MKKIVVPIFALSLLFASCSRKQASAPAERLAWHEKTLTKAYETIGARDAKWDAPAKDALAEFAKARAGGGEVESKLVSVGQSAQEAIEAGCDDPLIRYLYCRFAPNHSSKPLKSWQDQFLKASQGLENSGYSPLLKFYANDRGANALWSDRDQALWPEVSRLRRAAMNDLPIALNDKSLPVEEIVEACEVLLDTISANKQELADAYPQIEGPLFRNWPNSYAAYFVKGKFYYAFAWSARGGGYADKITEEGWDGFKKNLAVAEVAYRKAWSLNPKEVRIPTEMIEMAVSQQKDRAEMELWFQRGMELDTNNHEACMKKVRYLSPQWYGSHEELVAFGRECVASTKWGDRVPLVLAEMHYDFAQRLEEKDRQAYWRQPEIWPDIQASYNKFFELNPSPPEFYQYNLAYFAYVCGKWDDFNAQIKRIRDDEGTVDGSFFGSQEIFDKMVETAKTEAAKN